MSAATEVAKLKGLTSTAEWRAQNIVALEAILNAGLPQTLTTAAFTQPSVGGSVLIYLEATSGLETGIQFTVVDSSLGIRGVYEVDEVQTDARILATLLAWDGNATAGTTIATGNKVLVAAPNAQTVASLTASNGLGWVKDAAGTWSPTATTTTLTVTFKRGSTTVGTRTFVVTRDASGLLTATADTVDGITATLVGSGGRVLSITFTHTTGATISTFVATHLDGATGATGATGADGDPAPASFHAGTYKSTAVYPASATGLLSVVVYKARIFQAIAQGGGTITNQAPPSTAIDNAYWAYMADLATFRYEGEWKGPAWVDDDPNSRIALAAIAAHYAPKPSLSHSDGDYDAAQNVAIFAPSGGVTYFTTDNSDVHLDDSAYNPNLLLASELFGNAAWTKSAEITVSAGSGAAFDEVASDYTPLVDRLELTAGTPNLYQEVNAADLPNIISIGAVFTASIMFRSDVPCQIRGEIREYDGGSDLDSYTVETTQVGTSWTQCRVSHAAADADVNRLRVTWRIVDAGEAEGSNACTILAASGDYVDVTRGTLVRGTQPPVYVSNFVEIARQGTTYSASGPLITISGSPGNIRARSFFFGPYCHSPQVHAALDTGVTGKVSTPTASQPAGTYPAFYTLYVALFCSTSGAAIYYTLDGSTPSAASTLYAGPIEIEGYDEAIVLKAIGIKGGSTDSDILTRTYTFLDYYGGGGGYITP